MLELGVDVSFAALGWHWTKRQRYNCIDKCFICFCNKSAAFPPGAWIALSAARKGAWFPVHLNWEDIAPWILFFPGQSRWSSVSHGEPNGLVCTLQSQLSPSPSFLSLRHPWVQSLVTFCLCSLKLPGPFLCWLCCLDPPFLPLSLSSQVPPLSPTIAFYVRPPFTLDCKYLFSNCSLFI